jgi:hypothetical protein
MPCDQRNSTWIFTTTNRGQESLFADKFDACPFLSRAMVLEFESRGEQLVLDFACQLTGDCSVRGLRWETDRGLHRARPQVQPQPADMFDGGGEWGDAGLIGLTASVDVTKASCYSAVLHSRWGEATSSCRDYNRVRFDSQHALKRVPHD